MSQPAGHVVLRDSFGLFWGNGVCLCNGCLFTPEKRDLWLIDRLVGADSELRHLSQTLGRVAGGLAPAEVEAMLRESAEDPNSLIAVRPPEELICPDVIVVDFSAAPNPIDAGALVQALRSSCRVLHIGRSRRVCGDPSCVVPFAPGETGDAAESPFERMQWIRSLVRFHSRALLVLCGPEAMIALGDLVGTIRTVAILDQHWPGLVPPQQDCGARATASERLAWAKQLFYAMRYTSETQLHCLCRTASTTFAALEWNTLRNAAAVLYTQAGQEQSLREVRNHGRGIIPIGPVAGVSSARPPGAPRPGPLLILTQAEANMERVSGLARSVANLGGSAGITGMAVFHYGLCRRVRVAPDGVAFDPWPGKTPELEECAGVVVDLATMRDLRPLLRAILSRVPVYLMGERGGHPLRRLVPERLWLPDGGWAELGPHITRTRAAVLTNLQAARVARRVDPAAIIERLRKKTRGRVLDAAPIPADAPSRPLRAEI